MNTPLPVGRRLLLTAWALPALALAAYGVALAGNEPWKGDMTPPTAEQARTIPPPPAEPKGLARATFALG